ncbi:hypothetical protein EBU95_20445 [bacterium]|nr:hypothetical protein [bacterium]
MRYTPDIITELNDNEVFVFGSNLAGRHGAGAAKLALKWGAEYGKGIGMFGQTYAIPTKDRSIKTLEKELIKPYVMCFTLFARRHPTLTFLVTQIGCGLAGYAPKDIAPMFVNVGENVILPKSFRDVIDSI